MFNWFKKVVRNLSFTNPRRTKELLEQCTVKASPLDYNDEKFVAQVNDLVNNFADYIEKRNEYSVTMKRIVNKQREAEVRVNEYTAGGTA